MSRQPGLGPDREADCERFRRNGRVSDGRDTAIADADTNADGQGGAGTHKGHPYNLCGGSPEGRSPFGRGLGVSPRVLIIFPLPSRKGARGMVRTLIEARAHKQEESGHPS